MTSRLASELLSVLEKHEAKLLSWGFYDVAFSANDVDEALKEELAGQCRAMWEEFLSSGGTTAQALQQLELSRLLVRVENAPPRYRTRFAEGVRLTARLRQRFSSDDWATAPNLVSDVKIHLLPRRYPVRNHSREEVWNSIRDACSLPGLQEALFRALSVGNDGTQYSFSGFQRRAFAQVLGRYGKKGVTASVVCAGTGAGKTKAFYVPALLGVASEMDRAPFTKVIAVYPRLVLLGDQLRELLSEIAKLRSVLEQHSLRPIRVGALLGQTPYARWFEKPKASIRCPAEDYGWKRATNGYVVPFLKSPVKHTEDLIWRDSDRKANRTCLYRANGESIAPDVPDGELVLTREALMAEPPDILFASAEMLNREMGNASWGQTFGISATNKPRLLLLDEVHSYEGTSGAQVAWILRRWRHWAKAQNLHVVALSATLRDASEHVGSVIGISKTAVRVLEPDESEMTTEGMEYNLAVKGDPAAGTTLLATCIQTGMLLTRLMTPRHVSPSRVEIKPEEFVGRKVFGFTDNLDGVNRWYIDMLDAEHTRKLASLRQPVPLQALQQLPPEKRDEVKAREDSGQIWRLPTLLGHNLRQSLNIARCSSQDPGTNTGADLVVATSSLEVGYDDPLVGAILHYKRPRSMSSFIQRKGRAGRQRGTRPWTVVVLSDYGGDRWAFQHAEQLFQPTIDHIFLPVCNPYVLRIQAAYFLIDWLGWRIRSRLSPYSYLAAPGGWARREQQQAMTILEDFLSQGKEWQAFRRDFVRVFSRPNGFGDIEISETSLNAILWESPRPLLRHVVPSLLRKLQAGWRYADPNCNGKREDAAARRPLPEYVPSATFADLDLTEVTVEWVPEDPAREEPTLSVSHALFEACPGRVSKRFAVRSHDEGFWHYYSQTLLDSKSGFTSVHSLFPGSMFVRKCANTYVYQPQQIRLSQRPSNVRDSSNGWWDWQSTFDCKGAGRTIPVLLGQSNRRVVDRAIVFLHAEQQAVSVLRYAKSLTYEIRVKGRDDPLRRQVFLQGDSGEGKVQEAIGFEQTVDGIMFRVPSEHLADVQSLDEGLLRRARADFLLHRLQSDELFKCQFSKFLIEWVWQMSLSMLVATAAKQRCSLKDAQQYLHGKRDAAARKVLEQIFKLQGVKHDGTEVEGRLRQQLQNVWSDPASISRIENLEACLWGPPATEFFDWMRRRYIATVAQALRVTATYRLAQVSADDLAVDAIMEPDGSASIYLTETNSGGLGQIEMVAREILANPEAFGDGFEHALEYCPRTDLSKSLLSAIEAATRRGGAADLTEAFSCVRSAKGVSEVAEARDRLRRALDQFGLPATRQTVVAVVGKVLGPGSSPETDRLVRTVNRDWRRTEARIRLGIDPRVYAYCCLADERRQRMVYGILKRLGGGIEPLAAQAYALLQRMLFTQCEDSCPDCLDHPNRYGEMERPSRELARHWLGLQTPELSIEAHQETWPSLAEEILQRKGRVRLLIGPEIQMSAMARLPDMLVKELEVGHLLLPISVARIERTQGQMRMLLQVREVPDA